MKTDHRDLLPTDFSPNSRVWVYQSNRLFRLQEALEIENLLNDFAANWKSHGAQVKGSGLLLYGQFIVLMADEEATGVSGCSTDSSVRLIKDIEQRYGVNLFDRTSMAFVIDDKVQMLPLSQLNYALENKFITPETLFFNNAVQNKKELEEKWIVPLNQSWLYSRITQDVR